MSALHRALERWAPAVEGRGRVLRAGDDLDGVADKSVDTIICSLALCRAPATLLPELRRVIADEGELFFFEHSVARWRTTAATQRATSVVWSRMPGGCHLDRDTIGALRAAGFVVADCERLSPFGRPSFGALVSGRAIPRWHALRVGS